MSSSKKSAQFFFALSRHTRHHLRAGDFEKWNAKLARNRVREQRLSAPGRAMEEQPSRRLNTQMLVDLRVPQWVFDKLTNIL